MNRLIIFTLLLTSVSLATYGQEAVKPRPSPTAIVTMKYEDTYVKITYCQPHMKGRSIFGNLVPFGKVWRTGANEATEITLTEDIKIGGNLLLAGTYSIFTIPEENSWTIILNSGLGQWGDYTYNEDLDVLRIAANVTKLEGKIWEAFTMAFEQNNDKADLVMMWDNVKINVPIEYISTN